MTLILKKILGELKEHLVSREYREKCVEDTISRFIKILRREAIQIEVKKKNERPVFVLTYNPAQSVTSCRNIGGS